MLVMLRWQPWSMTKTRCSWDQTRFEKLRCNRTSWKEVILNGGEAVADQSEKIDSLQFCFFLSELIIMWALRWRWSVQVLVRTTGWSQITIKETLSLGAWCTALFDQSYLSRVTKMQNPAYADTYPGAVYTAEEVEIVFSPRLLFW